MNLLNWKASTSNLFYSEVILEVMAQWGKTTTVCKVIDCWNTERQISLYAAIAFDSFDTLSFWFTEDGQKLYIYCISTYIHTDTHTTGVSHHRWKMSCLAELLFYLIMCSSYFYICLFKQGCCAYVHSLALLLLLTHKVFVIYLTSFINFVSVFWVIWRIIFFFVFDPVELN